MQTPAARLPPALSPPTAIRAGSAPSSAACSRGPGEGGAGVFDRGREGVLGGEPVVDREHRGSRSGRRGSGRRCRGCRGRRSPSRRRGSRRAAAAAAAGAPWGDVEARRHRRRRARDLELVDPRHRQRRAVDDDRRLARGSRPAPARRAGRSVSEFSPSSSASASSIGCRAPAPGRRAAAAARRAAAAPAASSPQSALTIRCSTGGGRRGRRPRRRQATRSRDEAHTTWSSGRCTARRRGAMEAATTSAPTAGRPGRPSEGCRRARGCRGRCRRRSGRARRSGCSSSAGPASATMFTLQHRLRGHLGDARRPGARQAGLHRRPARSSTPARATRSCARCSARTRSSSSTRSRTSSQRKLLLPPFHGERMQGYEREDDRDRRARDRELADRHPLQAAAADAGDDPGDHPRDRLRRPRRRADGASCATALREFLDLTTNPRILLPLLLVGPDRVAQRPGLPPPHRPRRRADLPRDRRAPRAPRTSSERDDILSMLVAARHEDGSPMSDAEMRDELLTLLVAGHETTATSLSWAIERLVRHPEKLERLRAEVAGRRGRLPDRDDPGDAAPAPGDRRSSSAGSPSRSRSAATSCPPASRSRPASTSSTATPRSTPSRERFLPERFLDNPPGTYTWIPFGGGVRRCLGASFAQFEMAVVLQRAGQAPRDPPGRPRAPSGPSAARSPRPRATTPRSSSASRR